jgi:hypothetical protein
MNKKIKANTVKRFHYEDVGALKKHVYDYSLNYNFNLKLRAIGRRTRLRLSWSGITSSRSFFQLILTIYFWD